MVFLIRSYQRARRLDLQGRLTQGTIVDRWVKEHSDEPDEHFVTYEIGPGVRVMQKVKDREFPTLTTGAPVPVRYLPDDPTCSRMEIG